jgi:hypothetical protein
MKRALFAAILLAAGCRAEPKDNWYRCDGGADCPPGQSCFSGVCSIRGPDASRRDGGIVSASAAPLSRGRR